MHYSSRERSASSSESLPSPAAEYIEPLYESFFCPLTKKMMEDPVTIETGVTCEREAILEWFQSDATVLSSNLALKTTIEEWKKRNEEIRVKVARSTLSKATSENVVLEVLADLQLLCRSRRNKVKMCNVGLVPLLARLLEQKSRKLRCEAMETLRLLIQEYEEGKEMSLRTNAMGTAVKNLSSRHLSEKLASVSFLLELSKSEKLCERIGAVTGGIPMLITLKHNPSSDASIVEKAGEALKNLEKCPKNVGIMAENGLLDPLLDNLIDGPEDLRMEMGSILMELVLGDDAKTRIAERASGDLIRMLRSGNTLARKAAMKTLLQLSSHRPSCQILINADLLPTMAEELFIRKIDDEPMDSRADSADILANLLESGIDPEKMEIDRQGRTMASDYFIRNTCRMIKLSMPFGLNESLVRILISLMEWKRAEQRTVKAVKAADTTYTLIEFLSCLQDKLCAAAMELLIKLSPFMGHTIAEGLCKSRGQPEGLVDELRAEQITRTQELAATLLVKLPHRNLELNLSLLRHGGAAVALQGIQRIQRGETRATRHRRGFFEGLVGTLVRFTATLHEDDVLLMARKLNLTGLFTELVAGAAGGEEVQRLSAVGLEKLSTKSAELSAAPPPQAQPRKPRMGRLLPRILSPSEKTQQQRRLCPVHRGVCSPSSTFCLVEAGAVEPLLSCMDHSGAAVAEAALAALCTLLDDTVDVAGGAAVLAELGAVQQVLGALRSRQEEEGLRRRCFWVLERFLMKGGEAARQDIAGDRALASILMSAVHGGDSSMKQAAEIILRRLNKIPDVSISVIY
ncbi:unnamed protein product [Spirodela intermedia]|uniref:RING-type E3 ubiquitin transferase n=1 Tax=Spirodela intermedia TaxID=51605 RepID=A0A7I8JSD3_SPIIN|nr:unnamed protein product [Spirodela intermedia]CAA6672473.1 unnamed protein product [Spirodela intermedia]